MDITEGIKKIFLAGVGAVATTGEAAKNLIDNLVEKGELTVEQGKVLNEELKRNTKEKINKHVTVNVVNEFKDVFSAVDKMSREELEALKEKLESLKDAAPAEEEEAKEDCGCEGECSCEEKTETCDGENCDNK
ncbi:phasin family protein [Eisenbergiella tayi]